VTDAITTIEEWLPPRGMTSIPENPIKPAQANALHHALANLAELVEAIDDVLAWYTTDEFDMESGRVCGRAIIALARVKGNQ
jgi:hypothetical protein